MNLSQAWQLEILQLVPATGLCVAFALFAWGMRTVTAAAALAGTVLTLLLCWAAGPAALLPVLTVFLLAVFSTRFGRRKKERLGTAERRRGRTALQIVANLSAAVLCAAPLVLIGHPRYVLLAGASAALAEAAADTVSSELGQAIGGAPRLITTLRRVGAGEDGGITIAGTLFAFAAAAAVCAACLWADMLPTSAYWTVLCAAFFGTLVDSLLGATLERRGLLGNNSVNFTSSAFSAALAIVVLYLGR